MDPTAARDVAAFRRAREYLLTFAPEGVTDAVIDHYVEPPVTRLRPATMNGIYLRVLASAQNANMRPTLSGEPLEESRGSKACFAPSTRLRSHGALAIAGRMFWMPSRRAGCCHTRSDANRAASGPSSAARRCRVPPSCASSTMRTTSTRGSRSSTRTTASGWEWLSQRDKATSAEYGVAMAVPSRTALNHLRHLVALGLVRKRGSARSTFYEVVRP